ncbi:hypothetical protein BD311DRAFT_764971 [Dichomitus squalens]|uniref:Uncharacterized protein n=1 Tax=Dichomitus squalens TaxID=114155 RepID=A0A4Q9MDI4_9APHY|nr:hypothetical protein BD311DRAFT_764971 [Dichomitus squalens]
MEGLARTELRKQEETLKEQEAVVLAQREQILSLQSQAGDAHTISQSPLSDAFEVLRAPEDAFSRHAEFVDVGSTIASYDDVVLSMVRTLNFEISEVASQVTNAFRVTDTPDHDNVNLAFERAREAVGPVMAELLESIQHQDDPIIVDIALKADMVGFAAEVASAWDFQHQSRSVFTGLYKQMRRSESQSVCGQWRSRARKYSKQRLYNSRDLVPGFSHQLAERIADLLTVAGGSSAAEDIHAAYAPHLETIIRTALDLQRITGEEVVACDYEVLTARFDEIFDSEQMEDIYNGEIAATGPPGTVPRVLSTADLGLRRSQKVADAVDDDDGVTTTMLLKPKVVLDTVVYELGLVDEEDASPSTAEPSA